MSDIENLDVILGSYQRDNSEVQERTSENKMDLESNRQEERLNRNENDYRSYLNTNVSENSGMTVETCRAINSEISSQMSRKFEEMQTSLNSHILDAINTVIENRVLPSIINAVKSQYSAENANLDLRSDGLHPSSFSQVHPQRDVQSNGLHPEIFSQAAQDAQKDFPKLVATSSNLIGGNSVNSNLSDDEDGYDKRQLLVWSTEVKEKTCLQKLTVEVS